MATKVVADPATRIIDVIEVPSAGIASLNVVADIYSPLKDDWRATPSLQKLRFPFRTFGDPIGPGKQIGPYVFFDNAAGWRMKPYDVDHELTLEGNLVGEAAVLALDRATWLPQTGRTIVIRDQLSAQALTLETGVSGLTAAESQALLDIDANVATVQGDVSTIQASITSIDGAVVTMDTDIGAIKIDLGEVHDAYGLDGANPVTHRKTPAQIEFGAITLTLTTDVDGNVIVQRA